VHLLANKTGLGQLWDDPADYFQENSFSQLSELEFLNSLWGLGTEFE
jgi:hypothetical protein